MMRSGGRRMCEECIECQYVVVGLVAAEAACGTCGAMSFVALASHMRIVVCCSLHAAVCCSLRYLRCDVTHAHVTPVPNDQRY